MSSSYVGKGKSTDKSTRWSENKWDGARQQWYTSRKNESGEREYHYHPIATNSANTAQNYPSTVPRTFSGAETEQSQAQSVATISETTTNQVPGYTTGTSSAYKESDPYNPSATSSYPISTTSAGYHYAEHSADGLATGMNVLSLTAQATREEQATNWDQGSAKAKHIYREPGSEDYETLDPRYQSVPAKEQKRFWRAGRVFMMLWTEPAKTQQVGPRGGTRNGSHFSTVWLDDTVYSEIRRFVVMREGHGSSICSPINTYSGQATLKPNLPEQQQHAVIYTSDWPPTKHSYIAEDGEVVKEDLSKDPIKVNSEQRDREGDLGAFSRLNYSKIYTVENYVRVLNIGMVDKSSMQSLEANSYVRLPTAPPGRPTAYPPPANSEPRRSRDSRDDKSKGSKKHNEHGGGRRRHK